MSKFKKDLTLSEKSFDFSRGKVLPNDIDTEKMIICSLVNYKNTILDVIDTLKPTDFYSEEYSVIYTSIISLFKAGVEVSPLSLIRELRKIEKIEFCGGAGNISRISNWVGSRNILEDMAFVIQLAKKRELIFLLSEGLTNLYSDKTDVFDVVNDFQKGMVELLTFKMAKETEFYKIAKTTLKDIELKKEGSIPGLPSKFSGINELTGGYRRGTLRTVAGRPGMGKSIHLVNEASHLGKSGYKVMIFSLEMPSTEVMKRMMSVGTQIEGYKLDKNMLRNDELIALQKFTSNTENANIHIDDTGNIDIVYLSSQIKRIKIKNEMADPKSSGLDIVFIDYLQLMKLDNENRNIGIGEVTRKLKALSKELDISIVAYSQLNRAVETRGGDKRPTLSDLKESGSIEEDSDIVEFIYRAERYGITQDEKGESTLGVMEVITDKNRQGSNGTTHLRFLPTISTIMDSRSNGFSNPIPVTTDFEKLGF